MLTDSTRRLAAWYTIMVVIIGWPGSEFCRGDELPSWTMSLQVRGKQIEGGPLAWSDQRVFVLGRDGYLWQFAPHEAVDFDQIGNSFRPWSQAEMRGQLLREFNPGFAVTATGHYLVVHPVGQQAWADRFEAIYRSFYRYFSTRGIQLRKAPFPLVAVVFPNQQQFLEHARQTHAPIDRSVGGYYSVQSNRIFLYDVTAGQQQEEPWHVNATTIIHEAAHQVAFNTGVHSRVNLPPRWLAEGVATLFEAPGVWNSRHYPQRDKRINHDQLARFRTLSRQGQPDGQSLAALLDDRTFAHDPQSAYAWSWALVFYLAENQPARLARYLIDTADKEGAGDVSLDRRIRTFSAAFGSDLQMLETRVARFLEQL